MKKHLILFLIFFSANLLLAQKQDSTYKYWMTLGLWMHRGVTTDFSYSFSLGNNFYKVGYLTKGGFSSNATIGEDGYLFHSIDISLGKRFQSEWFQATFFAGPSYVFGKRRLINDVIENFYTVGLKTDIQLLFRPANEVGFGFGLFGAFNYIKSYVGININIVIGNGK